MHASGSKAGPHIAAPVAGPTVATIAAPPTARTSWVQSRTVTTSSSESSLATGAEPHADSDIDLAVAGLDDDAIAEVTLELEALAGVRVDLVALERGPARLLARIERDGKEV
jgi:predicted nucleotidyltransferase